MSLADRVTKAWGALTGAPATALETKASAASAVALSMKVGIAQYSPPAYRQRVRAFAANPVVFRATLMIAEAVAEIEPYVMLGETEDESDANPVVRLLKRPNPTQSKAEFVRDLVAFRRLHGNGFVEMVTGLRQVPWEVYPIRPERVQIIPGRDGFTAAFRYEYAGRRIDWPVDQQLGETDILHLKAFSPVDDIWGDGALAAAAQAVDLHTAAVTFQRAILDNGGAPSGAFKYAPNVSPGAATPRLTDEQFQALKAQLTGADSKGAKNAGKQLILDGGLDYVPFGMTMVDMRAKEMMDDAARQVALAFGVPPMLLGIPGDNTFANYEEANKAFFRQTVLPEARLIYQSLGRWIAARSGFKSDQIKIKIDEDKVYALADEVRSKWERLTLQGVPLKLDEIREAMGYEPVGGELGEGIYLDGFRAPLGAKVRLDEASADQAEVQLQQMLTFPGFDPKKDKDGDGMSNEGTGGAAGAKINDGKVDGQP